MTTDLFITQYEELITTNSPITSNWLRSMQGINQAITNHIQAIRNHEQELQHKEQKLDEVNYKLQKLVWEKEYLSNNI